MNIDVYVKRNGEWRYYTTLRLKRESKAPVADRELEAFAKKELPTLENEKILIRFGNMTL